MQAHDKIVWMKPGSKPKPADSKTVYLSTAKTIINPTPPEQILVDDDNSMVMC